MYATPARRTKTLVIDGSVFGSRRVVDTAPPGQSDSEFGSSAKKTKVQGRNLSPPGGGNGLIVLR